ncbi:hypothetical protein CCACVL1_04143 [Corchorus capsularis]|uniref:Uncharacterized protein n=1 Tax=Corchorus capsularis TaxID=210143 RepID=A0A1R3JUP7_COCAP|nr:hypothetical protein CCACVL1_04143 [Corchorus capsularis]
MASSNFAIEGSAGKQRREKRM